MDLHADSEAVRIAAADAGPRSVRAFLAVSLCILLTFAVFWSTTLSMVEIWRRSETFQHCFVVIPISLWLVWEQRKELAAERARSFWPGLVAVGMLGAAWLFGVLATAQVISHFALVGIVAAVVVTVFGLAWARTLWFPLFFLLFAVPFGEIIVPRLMDWTADFTVTALRFSGVPVYREGLHFVIPTGRWSVIDACSGIKFLIASVMAGSLYAFLMYRSWRRRFVFLGASIVLPVIANWLRAYSIVMIGHLSGNRLMTNDDHIVFGWVLFGAVMLVLYWLGARWREDRDAMPTETGRGDDTPLVRLAPAAVAAALAIIVWPVLGHALSGQTAAGDAPIVAPAPSAGWHRSDAKLGTWKPSLEGSDRTEVFVYEKEGRRVAIVVAAYRNQTQKSQVGSSANQLVRMDDPVWRQTAGGTRTLDALATSALPNRLRFGEVRGYGPDDRLLVWQWFWAGDAATSSAARTKLELARARLLRQPDAALWIAVYTTFGEDHASAARVLADFIREMGPSLESGFRASIAR